MLAHVEQELDPLSYHHWGRLAAITFAGYCLLISFLTREGPAPSLISLAIGDLVY